MQTVLVLLQPEATPFLGLIKAELSKKHTVRREFVAKMGPEVILEIFNHFGSELVVLLFEHLNKSKLPVLAVSGNYAVDEVRELIGTMTQADHNKQGTLRRRLFEITTKRYDPMDLRIERYMHGLCMSIYFKNFLSIVAASDDVRDLRRKYEILYRNRLKSYVTCRRRLPEPVQLACAA